jgi:hypothetical protein
MLPLLLVIEGNRIDRERDQDQEQEGKITAIRASDTSVAALS